jgi:hypothetical protein
LKIDQSGKIGHSSKIGPGEMGRQWMDQESWIMLSGRIMGQFGRIWAMDEFKKVQIGHWMNGLKTLELLFLLYL